MKTKINLSYGKKIPTGQFSNENLQLGVEVEVELNPFTEPERFRAGVAALAKEVKGNVDAHLPTGAARGTVTQSIPGITVPRSVVEDLKQRYGQQQKPKPDLPFPEVRG